MSRRCKDVELDFIEGITHNLREVEHAEVWEAKPKGFKSKTQLMERY